MISNKNWEIQSMSVEVGSPAALDKSSEHFSASLNISLTFCNFLALMVFLASSRSFTASAVLLWRRPHVIIGCDLAKTRDVLVNSQTFPSQSLSTGKPRLSKKTSEIEPLTSYISAVHPKEDYQRTVIQWRVYCKRNICGSKNSTYIRSTIYSTCEITLNKIFWVSCFE